ncbi:phosphohydrolase [Spirochaetia bacterium]|nr:phosphohydrolase [Spirochaetia bacterium]
MSLLNVQAAIENEVSMANDDDLNEKITEYIKNMPSLPVTVAKVIEICDNPQTNPADLNHVISLDPVLVGRVLKLVNSAYYGLSRPATNLVRAIIMLGINTVKNLALASAVLGSFTPKGKVSGLKMEGFWRHSLCTAVAAKLIAKKRGIDDRQIEEYFTAGLLHDIGKMPLAFLCKDYSLTIDAAEQGQTGLYRMEDIRLGINHSTVGGIIIDAWKLEGAVADVIRQHHACEDYKGAHKDVLYTTTLANHFAVTIGIGFSGDRYSDAIMSPVWKALRVDQAIFDEIEPLVNQEIERASIFLQL